MSFTFCGPFLEENVVSEQVNKFIYAENYTHRSDSMYRADYRPLHNYKNQVYSKQLTEDLQITSVNNSPSHTKVPSIKIQQIESKTCFNKFLLKYYIFFYSNLIVEFKINYEIVIEHLFKNFNGVFF